MSHQVGLRIIVNERYSDGSRQYATVICAALGKRYRVRWDTQIGFQMSDVDVNQWFDGAGWRMVHHYKMPSDDLPRTAEEWEPFLRKAVALCIDITDGGE